jgi:hypothetical protein
MHVAYADPLVYSIARIYHITQPQAIEMKQKRNRIPATRTIKNKY